MVLEEERSWWTAVREAVAGTEQDYTEGPLGRAVLLLAVPMVLEMSMESLFGILDVFWVGRLGADAVAIVGVTEALLTLVFAVALGLSHLHDGDGGAPHRREGPGGGGAHGRPGHRCWACWWRCPPALVGISSGRASCSP